MRLADLRRWEMQALDKLLGRLLNEAGAVIDALLELLPAAREHSELASKAPRGRKG